MTTATANVFTRVYALVNKTGILDTAIGKRLFRQAYFTYKMYVEDPFYMLAKRHPELFQGGEILDIGANMGYCTWVFRNACDDNFRVHSFEPAPNIYEELEKYFGKDPKVVLRQTCITDKAGTIELWLNSEHHADNRTITEDFSTKLNKESCVRVPTLSLDNYVEENNISSISFIKIDVQGAEELVFRGMTKVIERDAPSVVFEYSPGQLMESGFEPFHLINYFTQRGYTLYELRRNGSLAPLKENKLKEQETNKAYYTDILAVKRALSSL